MNKYKEMEVTKNSIGMLSSYCALHKELTCIGSGACTNCKYCTGQTIRETFHGTRIFIHCTHPERLIEDIKQENEVTTLKSKIKALEAKICNLEKVSKAKELVFIEQNEELTIALDEIARLKRQNNLVNKYKNVNGLRKSR